MQDPRLQQTQVYTEFSGLNALKAQARTDKQGALAEVARQFEGIFLSEMLKSMRQAGEVFAKGNFLNSQQSEFYRDMFDNQLSLTLSSNEGMGLADTLVRQLSRQVPGITEAGTVDSRHRDSITEYERSLPPLSRQLPVSLDQVNAVAGQPATVSVDAVLVSGEPLPASFETPEDFVSHLLPLAEKVAAGTGLNPRLMVAQAALETGWGKHMIEGEDGSPSYNLFGIKAGNRWQGESVGITTSEYRDGVRMNERADFRAYADYEASFEDYLSFLESNPRYRNVLAAADDPDLFAQRLQDAGYATDPNYASKIQRIMNGEQLNTIEDNALQASFGAEG